MKFLEKIKELKDRVLKSGEQKPAVLSSTSRPDMFSPRVYDYITHSADDEYYIVSSSQGLTKSQKAENVTKEVLTKFFGNNLDHKNPVILKELSGFVSTYLDFNGKMTKEGHFPFGIAMNREYGLLELIGENSSIMLYSEGERIEATHCTHALESATSLNNASSDSMEYFSDLVSETKAGRTLHGATIQLEEKNDGYVFVNKGFVSSSLKQAQNGTGTIFLTGRSEAYYANTREATVPMAKFESIASAAYYCDHGDKLYEESERGDCARAMDTVTSDAMLMVDSKEVPPIPYNKFPNYFAEFNEQNEQ